jgi:hypothetical protein
MHACDNAIGFEHKEVAAVAGFHHGAIIARAIDNGFCERKIRQKLAEQPVFSDLAQFHGGVISGMQVEPSADWRPPLLGSVMETRSPETQGR